MDTTMTHPVESVRIPIQDATASGKEAKKIKHEVGGGSIGEALSGGGAVVLGILGLIGLVPDKLAAVAAIAIGAALMLGGGTVVARYSRLFADATEPETGEIVGGSLAFEAVCGLVGVVLGILALVGLAPMALLGAASIVLGAGLGLAGGATARLNEILTREPSVKGRMAYDAMRIASGSEALVGLGAVVLGILALSGISPLVLTLVSMLALGGSVFLSGSSYALRVMTLFH
jgi:hypothetical protein